MNYLLCWRQTLRRNVGIEWGSQILVLDVLHLRCLIDPDGNVQEAVDI